MTSTDIEHSPTCTRLLYCCFVNSCFGLFSDTKGWGSGIAQHTSAVRLAAARPSAVSPPSMSLMVLADDAVATAAAEADLPISVEQQESIISALSLASSALLLLIIGGAGENRVLLCSKWLLALG